MPNPQYFGGGRQARRQRNGDDPNEFELHVPHKGRSFRARLRWRTSDAVGVEFLRDEPRGAAPLAAEDLTARMNKLESENALLRKRVLELMVRLREGQRGTRASGGVNLNIDRERPQPFDDQFGTAPM